MTADKGKRILINISDNDYTISDDDIDAISSSSDDDCVLIDDNDFRCSEEDDEEEEDDDDDDDDRCEEDGDDEITLSNQVLRYLQEKRDLQELSLKACKSYLRQHGLRMSGNKEECVQRVLEHWRIKDGAEILYPRSSFNINCKGDVCRGDIVLFKQKVYGSFEKVTRNGKLLGKRTIAGRVVKESYGAAKQQHTFTVEVLWSKGVKKLPPLFPLLVKGRNLYRLETYRQPWKNERERRNVLAEKHRRGAAARFKREKRKKAGSSGNSREGSKSQKVCHGSRSSKMMSCSREGEDFGRGQGVSASKHSTTNSSDQRNTRKHVAIKHQNPTLWTNGNASRKNSKPSGEFHYGSMPNGSRMTDFKHNFSFHDPLLRPAAQYTGSYHDICYIQSPRMAHENYFQYFPSEIASGRQQYGSFRCSVLGCVGPGSDRCVIAACWRCCRREGLRCNVHN
ncbi:uncharacterized protein LOC141623211 isoform X2 [Silene latifolia]|uniref:uncharacterized protein LOC141623211 isoform X2 n=1 Tax=Silene latifolia TaxID=37657 RepID=UPI003D77FB69